MLFYNPFFPLSNFLFIKVVYSLKKQVLHISRLVVIFFMSWFLIVFESLFFRLRWSRTFLVGWRNYLFKFTRGERGVGRPSVVEWVQTVVTPIHPQEYTTVPGTLHLDGETVTEGLRQLRLEGGGTWCSHPMDTRLRYGHETVNDVINRTSPQRYLSIHWITIQSWYMSRYRECLFVLTTHSCVLCVCVCVTSNSQVLLRLRMESLLHPNSVLLN